MKLSQFNFGEYDARREFIRGRNFFRDTFISPVSFALDTLRNDKNFIIVGQKGAGKTACQLYLEDQLTNIDGYICGLISFYDDLTPEDYKDFAKTQKIELIDLGGIKNIELMYDFKEVWKRLIFIKIAKLLRENGFDNIYTHFCLSSIGGTNKILDGIKKSLKVEVKIPLTTFEAKVTFDPSVFEGSEITLDNFNRLALQLMISECAQYRLYFFVDELVISTFNTKSDDYTIRSALIRDLVRVCCFFNDTCVKNNLDISFICNLRPEIRTMLNNLDPEISKIMDGNDVFLSWESEALLEIMTQKIVHGAPAGMPVDADVFLPKNIRFGNVSQEFVSFLLNQTWRKPRDIVRFLKCYAKINPNDTSITEEGTKKSLNEYARVSAVELFEQLSVDYDRKTLNAIRDSIKKNSYSDAAELIDLLGKSIEGRNIDRVVEHLYEAGVIGNIDRSGPEPRYFFYHRQEEHLDPDMKIMVHAGLWNFFNIRHR